MFRTGWSRKSVWLLLIASLAFNAGVGVTFAVLSYREHAEPGRDEGDRPGPRERGPGPHLRGLVEQLDLTPDQAEQVQAAEETMLERVHELRRSLRQESEALAELMAAPQPDRQAIAARLGAIASAREQMQGHLVEHYLDVKELLDPDQSELFNETIRRVFSRGGPGRGGPGRGGHGGPRGPHSRGGRGKGGPFRGGA